MQPVGSQSSRGIFILDSSISGMPYILHPRVMSECSHYFLDWVSPRKGDPFQNVCIPDNAGCHDNVRADDKAKDCVVHF